MELTIHETHFYNLICLLTRCRLEEREMLIMMLRHFCGFKLREIGADYNVSQERIGQIEGNSRNKLRVFKKRIGDLY